MRGSSPASSSSSTPIRRRYSSARWGRFFRCHQVGRSRHPRLPITPTSFPPTDHRSASSCKNRTRCVAPNRATYAGWSFGYSLFPNTAAIGAEIRLRIVWRTAPYASTSFRSVVSPASRTRSTGPSRSRSAATAARFSCPWMSPTAASRIGRRTQAASMNLSRRSELADDRLTGPPVHDRESGGRRIDGPHLLGPRPGLPGRRIHEDDAAVLVDADGVDVSGDEDVGDLVDDEVVLRLRGDRRLAAVDGREVAPAEHRLHAVERTLVAQSRDRGHEVVHAPTVVGEDPHSFQGQEARGAREDHVAIE